MERDSKPCHSPSRDTHMRFCRRKHANAEHAGPRPLFGASSEMIWVYVYLLLPVIPAIDSNGSSHGPAPVKFAPRHASREPNLPAIFCTHKTLRSPRLFLPFSLHKPLSAQIPQQAGLLAAAGAIFEYVFNNFILTNSYPSALNVSL